MVRRVLIILAVVVLLPLIGVAGAVLLVQSEWGEAWLEKQVAQRIHRDVEIEDIKVRWGWPLALAFDRVRIGNPEWAKTPSLIDANGLYAQFELGPLFRRRIVIPYMAARQAQFGLETDGERATWRFGHEERDPSRIELTRVSLEDGHVVYRDESEDTALEAAVKGKLGATGEISVDAKGKFRGETSIITAKFPDLEPNPTRPVRFDGKARVGKTDITASGLAGGSQLETLDVDMKLGGATMKDLKKITGMTLPDTPPYRVAGHLKRNGKQWVFDPFDGKVGDSDLAGSVTYHKEGKRPLFVANLRSKLLDFDDLGPLVGAPPKTGAGETSSAEQKQKAAAVAVSSKVLPKTQFNTERWDDMDADVKLEAKKVLRPKQLPVDTLSTHLVLKDGVMTLDPLNFGYAGGRITSYVKLDPHQKPMRGDVRADVQGVKLGRLFPNLKDMDEALGTLFGRVELAGRGRSVGELLDTSNGKMTVAANGGQVSQLLTELLEIDVAKAMMLLGTRKQQVELRCAVGHLAVKDGVATPESFVVDTSETNVQVGGQIDLGEERLALETHAKGKSPSLLTLRSPIVVEGPFKTPRIHPKLGPAVAQAGAAAALAAVNPALAIAPFVSRGSGKDADCDKLLAEARAEGAVKKQG
jgi:uncharacterized protein involved in outer membrane biogenesis